MEEKRVGIPQGRNHAGIQSEDGAIHAVGYHLEHQLPQKLTSLQHLITLHNFDSTLQI